MNFFTKLCLYPYIFCETKYIQTNIKEHSSPKESILCLNYTEYHLVENRTKKMKIEQTNEKKTNDMQQKCHLRTFNIITFYRRLNTGFKDI